MSIWEFLVRYSSNRCNSLWVFFYKDSFIRDIVSTIFYIFIVYSSFTNYMIANAILTNTQIILIISLFCNFAVYYFANEFSTHPIRRAFTDAHTEARRSEDERNNRHVCRSGQACRWCVAVQDQHPECPHVTQFGFLYILGPSVSRPSRDTRFYHPIKWKCLRCWHAKRVGEERGKVSGNAFIVPHVIVRAAC